MYREFDGLAGGTLQFDYYYDVSVAGTSDAFVGLYDPARTLVANLHESETTFGWKSFAYSFPITGKYTLEFLAGSAVGNKGVLGVDNIRIAGSTPAEVYFGEDLNPTIPKGNPGGLPDSPGRLGNYPNAKTAHDLFMNRLIGPKSETFESFSSGILPSVLYFGNDTATFTGAPYILGPADYHTDNTFNGVWPVSGDKCLLQHSGLGNTFQVDFSHPQAALGFYATDVEMAVLTVTLYTAGGVQTEYIVHDSLSNSGSILFWGVVDIQEPFIRAVFSRINNVGDGFGFDDLTIGRVGQVCHYKILGDLNLDCKVNIVDLALMAGNWLVDCTTGPIPIPCIPL